MKRHLPEPAQYSRLRRYLAALPHGMPTSFTWVLAAAVVATPIFTVHAILPALGGGARDRVEVVQPNAAVVDERGREGSQAARTVTPEIAASPAVADPGSSSQVRVARMASPSANPDMGDDDGDASADASADPTMLVEPSASVFALSDTYLAELGQADRQPDANALSRDPSAGTVVETDSPPSTSAAVSESTPSPDEGDRVDPAARDQPSLEDGAPASDPVSGRGQGDEEAPGDEGALEEHRGAAQQQVRGRRTGQPSPTSSPETGDD